MTKNQKILLIGAIVVFLCLTALIIVLIVKNAQQTQRANEMQEQAEAMQEQAEEIQMRADSLKNIADQIELDGLTAEFDRLNAEFSQYNEKQLNIKNDTLKRQYNEAKARVNALIKELEQEKKSGKADKEKIKKLEAEITTLKDIAKHYLEEMTRLKAENDQIKAENAQQKQQIEELTQKNASVSETNAKLEKTVEQAKQLSVSSISVSGYNKEDAKKAEKEIKAKKVKVIGVNFTVAQNNTAAAGTRTFYIRIISPEGSVLPGGPSFTVGGETLTASASKDVDYKNEQATFAVYYNVSNTTLIAGDYKAEVYEGGKRLATSSFSVKK